MPYALRGNRAGSRRPASSIHHFALKDRSGVPVSDSKGGQERGENSLFKLAVLLLTHSAVFAMAVRS